MGNLSGQILIVIILTLLGKLGAFFRDLLLSYTFGAGIQTDAFFIANSVPGLVFSGVLATVTLVFLPIYIRAKEKGAEQTDAMIATSFIFYLSIALILTIICFSLARPIIEVIATDASQPVKDIAIFLTRIMSIGFVFSAWVALQNAIQQANKAFIWPMAVPVYNHLAVMIGITVALWTDGNITYAVIAAIIGWILQAPLQWMLARRFYILRLFQKPSRDVTRTLLWMSFPVFISVSLDQITIVLDLFLGSAFREGAVSHLSFSFRLTILAGGLFALPISFFIFPYLSDSLKDGTVAQTRSLLTRGIGLVLLLNLPILIYIYLEAELIVRTVFMRGAFDESDVQSTAAALQMYIIATVFMGLREVLNRVYMADDTTFALVVFSAVALPCNFISSLYLQTTMGLSGIALGTTIGAMIFVILQIGFLFWKRRDFLSQHILGFMGIAAFGCIVVLIIKPWMDQLLPDSDGLRLATQFGVLGFVYMAAVGVCLIGYAWAFSAKLWKL